MLSYTNDTKNGWLGVPVFELDNLGIGMQISTKSFRCGEWAFLDEECDMPLFINAYKKVVGREPFIKYNKPSKKYAKIRNHSEYWYENAWS